MIRVEPLTGDNKRILDEYLRRDPATNVFVLEDLHDPEKRKFSKFYLALRQGAPEGYLLIYEQALFEPIISMVFLRGSVEATKHLLSFLQVERAIVHVDPELAEIVAQRLPVESEMMTEVLLLDKGSEKLAVKHPVKRLAGVDAEAVMRLSERVPEWQPYRSLEQVEKSLEERAYFGIFIDHELVSMAGGHRMPATGLGVVGPLLTAPEHRGRGLATSAVSKVVQHLFEEEGVNRIVLNTPSRNAPAKRVYQKIGFRIHRKLVWLDLRTGLELFRIWGTEVRPRLGR